MNSVLCGAIAVTDVLSALCLYYTTILRINVGMILSGNDCLQCDSILGHVHYWLYVHVHYWLYVHVHYWL